MHSQPIQGEELARMLREMQDELRRLSDRIGQLARDAAALEVRVAALE